MLVRRLLFGVVLCLVLAACQSSEERAEAAYQRGLELVASGDDARARIEFQNALKLSDTHTGAYLELARLFERAGNDRRAAGFYVGVVEQQPDNVEALQALSRLAFLGNDWDSFNRYAPRAVEAAPDDIQSKIIVLAQNYRTAVTDKDDPARDALLAEAETLRTAAPDSRVLRRLLIDGYLQASRFEDALAEIEKAIQANPRKEQFYQLKVQVLARLGDDEGVERELRRIVETFPKDDKAQANLLRFLIARGKIDEAEHILRTAADAAPGDDPAPYVNLVQFLAYQRGQDAALAELETRIAAHPDAYLLRALRASFFFDMGRRDEAIAEMQALTTLEDEKMSVDERRRLKVGLAQMLVRNGNEVGARRLVEEILTEDPSQVGALKMRARWLIDDDRTNDAITALRSALATSPDDSEAMTLMAQAYERAGDTDLMLNFLSLAVESSKNAPEESLRYARALVQNDRLDQAEPILITALRLQPSNQALLGALGEIYLQQNDIPRARQVADALRRIDTPETRSQADAIELELVAREEGTEKALDFLGKLAETHDEDDRMKLALIRGLLQNGQGEKALDYADDLVRKNPENPSYVYFKALTQAAARDYAAAEKTLTGLLETHPDMAAAWLQLARFQSVTADRAAAMATIDKGLTRIPGSPDLLWAKASYLEQQGDIDGAIALYEQLYEGNSSSVIFANNLASLLSTYRSDPESLDRARVIARRLKDTNVPALQDTYGWILYRSGEVEEARTYLESAAAALTQDPLVQVHLGLLYTALGQPEDAKAQLDRARDVAGPVPPPAVQQRLDELASAIGSN